METELAVNERIVYQICPHQGICTLNCKERSFCTIRREKILLYGVVLNLKKRIVEPEAYMNEIVYLKRSLSIDPLRLEQVS